MYLLGQKMLSELLTNRTCMLQLRTMFTMTQDLLQRGGQPPKGTVRQRLSFSAELHLAAGTQTCLTQKQHSPELTKLVQGEKKAGRLLQLCSEKGSSTPQAMEETMVSGSQQGSQASPELCCWALSSLSSSGSTLQRAVGASRWRGCWRQALKAAVLD